MKTVIFALAALLAGSIVMSVPAFAQSADEDPVAACRSVHAANAEAHIACLESAIQRLREQSSEQQAAAAAPERPAWSLPGFRERERAAEVEEVRVQLVGVQYGRDGLGLFRTADGQYWRETTSAPARRRLDTDRTYEAVIERGVLGGFRMTVDGIRWEYKVEPLN